MDRGAGLTLRSPSAPGSPLASAMSRLVAVVPLLVGAGCTGDEQLGAHGTEAASPSQVAVSFTDAAAHEHVLDAPARRVISLVPSATETIRALGAEDALAGVTDYDDPEWTAEYPSVGGGLEPNLEAVVALRPDAVIRFHGDQDPRTPDRLDDLGIRHVAVRPVALADVYETNRIVGELVGRPRVADSLSSAIRRGLDDLRIAIADLPRLRVVYMLGGSPPWVSGPDTYISEILTLVGGDNVFSDLTAPYQAVSPEELRSRTIDVVLVANAGSYDPTLTPGARVEVIGDALQVPGPDVVADARAVAEIIHQRPVR